VFLTECTEQVLPTLPPEGGNRSSFRNTRRDISVGTARGCGVDSRSSIHGRVKRFSLLHSVQTGSEPPTPPIGGSFPGVKRPGREADHPPLSSAEGKNG
jgi:hypothetical protein